MRNSSQSITCATCRKDQRVITDPDSGEIICSNCGMVITEKVLDDIHQEWRAFSPEGSESKARTGAPTSLSRHDRGLATIIGRSDKDAAGQKLDTDMRSTFERLRTWDSRMNLYSSTDRNLWQAFSQLNILKDKLGLSDAIVEKTAYIYRKAEEKQLTRGRTIVGMLAAALYIACREMGTPRTLKDISIRSNIKRKDIARNCRLLIRELDIKVPIVDPMKCIATIANAAEISEKTKRKAFNLMDELVKKEVPAGKHPMSLAATILYVACRKTGEYRTQVDIAKAAGVTEVTIRNRFKDLSTKNFDLNN
ncbi:MAG TPA: transcription initiation factor IIB [Nitrososphaeraceae archaeon]